eukprot:1059621-Pyramimonas_sp.AAC.1
MDQSDAGSAGIFSRRSRVAFPRSRIVVDSIGRHSHLVRLLQQPLGARIARLRHHLAPARHQLLDPLLLVVQLTQKNRTENPNPVAKASAPPQFERLFVENYCCHHLRIVTSACQPCSDHVVVESAPLWRMFAPAPGS